MFSKIDKFLTEYWSKKVTSTESISFAKTATYIVIVVVLFAFFIWAVSSYTDHVRAQKELDRYNKALEMYNKMR